MRILIAEDEQAEARALKHLLHTHYEAYFHEIILVTNGEEAVVQAEKEKFDLIFMDIEMQACNGIVASEKIREKNKQVAIIMVTAHADFQYAQRSFKNEVFDYIVKPYSLKTLKESVDRFIAKKEEDMIKQEENSGVDDVEQVKQYIEEHYEKHITLDEIAKELSISKFHLCRIFKEAEDMSIMHFLLQKRIEQAKLFLLSGYSVSQAGFRAGFRDPAYFGKKFKSYVGKTPAEFKRSKEEQAGKARLL